MKKKLLMFLLLFTVTSYAQQDCGLSGRSVKVVYHLNGNQANILGDALIDYKSSEKQYCENGFCVLERLCVYTDDGINLYTKFFSRDGGRNIEHLILGTFDVYIDGKLYIQNEETVLTGKKSFYAHVFNF